MPLVANADIEVSTPVTATAFNVLAFTVEVQEQTIHVVYQCGNMDASTPPVFIPSPGIPNRELKLSGSDFVAVLVEKPLLYPAIKSVLYGAIEAAHGISGGEIS